MVATALLARREPSSPSDELVGSVHEVFRAVLRRAHPTLEAEGISMGQFWALHLVSSLRSASLSTVARHLSVSAPTVCSKVDQLEAAGLILRHRSQRDHRTVELSLTPKGRRVEARIWSRIGRTMAEAIEEMPRGDVATAVRVFRELSVRLDGLEPSEGGAS
jgi:MarR family transcriptional regulator, organic hydroperoxide resistance regulator